VKFHSFITLPRPGGHEVLGSLEKLKYRRQTRLKNREKKKFDGLPFARVGENFAETDKSATLYCKVYLELEKQAITGRWSELATYTLSFLHCSILLNAILVCELDCSTTWVLFTK